MDSSYRPRHPQQLPFYQFYQLVERFYPEFEAVYEERYGSWWPTFPPKPWRRQAMGTGGKFLEGGVPSTTRRPPRS